MEDLGDQTMGTEEMPYEVARPSADVSLYGAEFWGIARHELIASAAMAFLSDRTRGEVERILAPIDVSSLGDVAGWADRLRGAIPNADEETIAFLEDDRNRSHGTWHYVNVPNGADGYSRDEYPEFTRDDDVVQMIRQCVLVLKGESDRLSELNALRWLAHLVGDVHQPIHVGCGYLDRSSNPADLVFDPEAIIANELEHDRGGNRIKLPGGASLHSYWDSRLLPAGGDDHFDDGAANLEDSESDTSPEMKRLFIEKLVNRIRANEPVNATSNNFDGSPPEDWAAGWATDSIRYARDAYQSLEIVQNQAGGNFKVDWEGKAAYDARCKPIAQGQVDLAAINLAALLNAIWSVD